MISGDIRPALNQSVHPPARPGAPAVDASYRALTASLPPHLAALARQLAWKLGLTSSPDGSWGDFVSLHPNRELPLYAAEAGGEAEAPGLIVSAEELHRFVRAHHAGGFYWLLRDRLADGQVPADEALLELSRRYALNWRQALAEATGDGPLTDALIADGTARWRRGTAAERRALCEGSLRPGAYAALVRDKLSWIGIPSRALLLARGGARRATAFGNAHDLFLLGLQAVDDVMDRDEDRALSGGDVPGALGCSPGALLRSAPKLLSRAAALATDGGFTWLGAWLEAFSRAVGSLRLEGDAVLDELEAIGIVGEIEETIFLARDDTPDAAREATRA